MKNKKPQTGILAIAIGVIISVVILGAVFTFLSDNALTATSNAETIATTMAVPFSLEFGSLVESTLVINNGTGGTGTVATNILRGNFSIDATNGILNMTNSTPPAWINATTGANTLNYTYNYLPSSYITSSTARIVVGLITVLMAIAILVFVAPKN